jgi:hypothetical protein
MQRRSRVRVIARPLSILIHKYNVVCNMRINPTHQETVRWLFSHHDPPHLESSIPTLVTSSGADAYPLRSYIHLGRSCPELRSMV